MKIVTCFALSLLLVIPASLSADDQDSLNKQLSKINAMCTDTNGRRVVSRFLSEHFRVSHQQMLATRRQFNLNYGSVFLFYQLAATGVESHKLTTSLGQGRSLLQIGTDAQVHWGKIAGTAKEFNKQVGDKLYDYFVHQDEFRARDTAENYLPILDNVPADSQGYSRRDVDAAENLYRRQRYRADSREPQDRRIDNMNETQIRHSHDPIRDGFPTIAPPMAQK